VLETVEFWQNLVDKEEKKDYHSLQPGMVRQE